MDDRHCDPGPWPDRDMVQRGSLPQAPEPEESVEDTQHALYLETHSLYLEAKLPNGQLQPGSYCLVLNSGEGAKHRAPPPLTFYVADLDVLCVRQGGDVDLGTRRLLQKTHIPSLLANQSTN